jgi:hypothetical protein
MECREKIIRNKGDIPPGDISKEGDNTTFYFPTGQRQRGLVELFQKRSENIRDPGFGSSGSLGS